MKYLRDTDHISILQRQSGEEYDTLSARIRQESRSDLGFFIITHHLPPTTCHPEVTRLTREKTRSSEPNWAMILGRPGAFVGLRQTAEGGDHRQERFRQLWHVHRLGITRGG